MPDTPFTAENPTGSEASYMPNKTIYVADADLPVFERAQELAGENLSATIAGALRRYVQAEEARAQGFAEISLKVGSHKTASVKRFLGRELARRRERDAAMRRVVTETVFQTAKGHFALYTRDTPDWTSWATSWGGDWDFDIDMDLSTGSWRVRKSGPPHEPGHAHSGGPSGSASGSASASGGARDSSTWTSDDERRLDVYDTVDELIAAIGPELAEAVTRALHGEEDEFLDI